MKARAFASIVTAGLVVAGIAGCTFVTPIATKEINDVTDGVNVTVGDVKLLNTLVITKNGQNGNLVAQAYNGSDERVTLSIQYDVDGRHTKKVTLAPGKATDLGYGSKGQVFLPDIATDAGGLLALYVQYGSEPGKQITVPVLTNRQGEYQKLDPTTPPKPTPTPTMTPLSGATESPAPSSSPTP
ncbi:hypothetical protein GCM10009840_00620 [Pseudolysinimonas kribbensis]|uniref:DNA modification methylase n=1 Tax=Pseudolysinimonas kribbensis TaxID=433641 RepID=A0ABQ6KA59_9MICO|nr:hypothetical protein [Pseudolysinimonas kribbensis]GMA95830.1 hypothetical protein GCM10025881_26540 [Pseudolysinimonas kribbensis]